MKRCPFMLVELPAVSRREARGFTLVELLIVIAIVGLLVSIVFPSLSSAGAMARMVACASNLSRVDTAFATRANLPGRSINKLYPYPDYWPGIPQDHVTDRGIYICPESPTGFERPVLDSYYLYSSKQEFYIPFEETPNHCKIIDHGEYYEYIFDAGEGLDHSGTVDWDDAYFHVTKGDMRIATFAPRDESRPYRGIGTMSLWHGDKPVPGWENLQNVDPGAEIVLSKPGGVTSYGYNPQAQGFLPKTPKIILLDYTHPVANDGEDVSANLREAARHLGRLNVLFGDGRVVQHRPHEIDPMWHGELWWE